MYVQRRVTRLVVSLIRRLFTLGSFSKTVEIARIFAYFFYSRKIVYILMKNGLGNILGDFFHELIWSPWSTCVQRQVEDKGVPALLDSMPVTMKMLDRNDQKPVFTFPASDGLSVTVDEVNKNDVGRFLTYLPGYVFPTWVCTYICLYFPTQVYPNLDKFSYLSMCFST
jgi:hypothetical protein